MKIIINADDLGKSQEVNDAIFELMDKKLITSATILANGEHLEDAITRMKKYPNCSFGIHLYLTEFKPVTNNKELAPLLDNNGYFYKNKMILKKLRLNKHLSNAIYLELCSQIEKLLSLGVKISHIDSHHHVHNLSSLFNIIKQIQKKYSKRKIRISYNIYDISDNLFTNMLNKLKVLYRNIHNYKIINFVYKAETTIYYSNLMTFYKNVKKYKRFYSLIELSVHPGSKDRIEENSLFDTKWFKELKANNALINYNDMCKSD